LAEEITGTDATVDFDPAGRQAEATATRDLSDFVDSDQ
jgi:hypothetical protein